MVTESNSYQPVAGAPAVNDTVYGSDYSSLADDVPVGTKIHDELFQLGNDFETLGDSVPLSTVLAEDPQFYQERADAKAYIQQECGS